MKYKKPLKGLLIVIIFIGFSGLGVFGFADDTAQITYTYPGQNSYYDITVTIPGEDPQTYPGWCADSRIFVASDPYGADLVSSCGLELGGTEVYDDDENWKAINYLVDKWNSGGYPGASWPDIQQVIWYYADAGYSINDQAPIVMDTTYIDTVIMPDVLANCEGYEGPPCSVIIVEESNPGEHQLLFFMVPEIPLGTLGAFFSMFSAYMIKRKWLKS